MQNLIDRNVFYYHPLTRKALRPRALIMWPDGGIVEEAPSHYSIQFKDKLTDEDIVSYFYSRVSLDVPLQNIPRDTGAVRYLVKEKGLDLALFSLDCLLDDYLEAEDRDSNPPKFLEAGNYVQDAINRIGVTKQIANQYGIGESSWSNGANR